MVWLLLAAAFCAIIVVAGRAHSRFLDRLEARQRAVMTIILFNVSPDILKETEFTVDLTSETIHDTPIELFDSFVGNEDKECVRSRAAYDRGFDRKICQVPDEPKLLDGHRLPEMAAGEGIWPSSQAATRKRWAKN